MKNQILHIAIYILLTASFSYGQGFEKFYPNDTIPSAVSLDQTMDHGFILATMYYEPGTFNNHALLIKTDINGDTLWTKQLDVVAGAQNLYINSIQQTISGEYIIAGEIQIAGNANFYLTKVDNWGDTLWSKTYGGNAGDDCQKVEQTTDGGYILFGRTFSFGNGASDIYIVKTDAIGDTLWTKTYGGTSSDYVYSGQQTADGGYIISGHYTVSPGNQQIHLIKLDASGNTSWVKIFSGVDDSAVRQTNDGGYILGRPIGADFVIHKLDASGTTQWTQTLSALNYFDISSALESTDGGYCFIGNTNSNFNYILKVNSLGVLEYEKLSTYGFSSFAQGINVGNGYAIVGHDWTNSVNERIFLIKTDSLGNTYTNHIKGNIFNDLSSNCLKDIGEQNLGGIMVQAVGNQTWYGSTDSLGNYCIQVDTGSYIVTATIPPYWQTCANSVTVNLPNPYTNDTINFPFQAQINCPLMYVDLSAPFLRPTGNGSNYTVTYCNNGTMDATNVSVVVQIDPALNIIGASIPITSQTNNNLTFNIGNVAYGTCGDFTIHVIVDANALIGQTHCSEAHISPDSLCLANPWQGAIIDATATCSADSVTFKLYNVGNNLFNSKSYYVFEDHFIMDISPSGNILPSDSFSITIPADTGKTYRISIAQDLGYPALLGDSVATAALEGCVPYSNGAFNTGFITQFSNGNSAPSIAVDCQQNIASYDPNDKSAQPEGYQAQHYIYNNTDLDYKIRFQNTGTDTAFLVVVRDTISPLMDLTTLEMGASSHPYTWRIYGAGILEVTFSNIMLPDSNVNELASNGFFRYRMEQKQGNVAGAVIYNAADIYFDFNAPITTNQTYHTIGENFVIVLSNPVVAFEEAIEVNVYPNPFTYSATFEVEGKDYNELLLSIYDLSGREIIQKTGDSNKIELSKGNLNPGVYIYRLLGDNGLINTGKIIVQ